MPLAVRLSVALVLLMISGGCSASRPWSRSVPPPPGPVLHLLPNGIPIIIPEHRASEVVAVQLWVRAGGHDEAAPELGLADYLEHMLPICSGISPWTADQRA